MSITTEKPTAKTFTKTVAELKSGVETVVQAQKDTQAKLLTTATTLTEFNKGTIAAVLEANKSFAAGVQALWQEAATVGQSLFADSQHGFRSLAAAKTPRTLFEAQVALTQAAANRTVHESVRFSRLAFDLAERAAAPVLARATLAAETFVRT